MKKLLLLTYFFPPANFAGSYRVASFAKYLHRFGWYPVVVTRQFQEGTASFRDLAAPVGDEVIHEQHEGYEVYRLPYKANWRDRLFHRYGDTRFVTLRKLLSFAELVLQTFFWWVIPYANLYRFSLQLLKQDPSFKALLASGNPYQLFFFCHLLHQKTGIPWVADYRDEWNSGTLSTSDGQNWLLKLMSKLGSNAEKKWVGSSECITTVTNEWALQIGEFVNKNAYCIRNGFESELNNTYKQLVDNSIHIGYLGSVYYNQPFDELFEVFKEIAKSSDLDTLSYHLHFFGIGQNENGLTNFHQAISKLPKETYTIYPYMNKADLYHEKLPTIDAFLLLGYKGRHGVHTLKLYDYLHLARPVIVFPAYPEAESLLLESGLGLFCSNEHTTREAFSKLMEIKQGEIPHVPNLTYIQQFSREAQAKRLSEVLDEVIIHN